MKPAKSWQLVKLNKMNPRVHTRVRHCGRATETFQTATAKFTSAHKRKAARAKFLICKHRAKGE